ncbi:MAG: ABC transporter ATP-binding protein, partial [Eubacteriales bacterium]|nr:ABC transporter ATP-binding protein [Eubacteriales bacterium]
MSVIELSGLTKDYGQGRGIFDLDLKIEEGEMLGYAGTNGSGKTTTIRSILGFLRPTRGEAQVLGMESFSHASEVAGKIGYVPGEIAFPDLRTGTEFLKSQAEFLGLTDLRYADELVSRLQLDPLANLKRMSKGMKQKTALAAALMKDAPILILDEPTTGLD